MAYIKTQWVNNTTPINDTNLNKIEQGIYDNSLVTEAIADKLNPTDTETYKTAELTEGQITDVIGVNDIVIKGQTSQNGEPTPDSPVDVNVVSGSNVINTSNKNILNLSKYSTQTVNGVKLEFKNGAIICNGTATANVVVNLLENNLTLSSGAYALSGCPSGGGISSNYKLDIFKVNTSAQLAYDIGNGTTFTLSEQTTFDRVRLVIFNGKTVNNLVFKPQLEKNSAPTAYEPYQGKELPLDLPVENLFYYSDNFVSGTNAGITVTKQSDGSYTFVGTATSTGVNVWLNGNYNNYNDMVIENALFKIPAGKTITVTDLRVYMVYEDLTKKAVAEGTTLTLPQDAYIMAFRALDTTPNTTYNRVCYPQLEISSKANAYTPYGTDPIELCKIGNYQDYFYKSGSKWYLHKEIGKVVLNGSEDWTYSSSNTVFYTDVINALAMQDCNIFCDRFKKIANSTPYANINNGEIKVQTSTGINARLICKYTNYTSATDFKTWLASNNTKVYYPLETTTDTEITDTTLISQLEAIYNAPLYEQTNITQTNNDLPMILDITACKDNINGIKAFIRK